MPTLHEKRNDTKLVRAMILGESGSGKTGSLASLVEAGYNLAIIDLENGTDILASLLSKKNPELLKKVHVVNVHDNIEFTKTGPKVIDACGFKKTSEMIADFPGLGDITELGSDWVIVIDTLGTLGDMAFRESEDVNKNYRDKRLHYANAGNVLRSFLAEITSESNKSHLLMMCHVSKFDPMEDSKKWKNDKGQEVLLEKLDIKAFPRVLGRAVSENASMYVNTLMYLRHANGRRTFATTPVDKVNVKWSDATVGEADAFKIDTGLADIFSILTNGYKPSNPKE